MPRRRANAGTGGARPGAGRIAATAERRGSAFLNIEAADSQTAGVSLEYRPMPDESNVLPTSRVVRWLAIALLIGLAVVWYFRAGTRVAPLTAPAPSAAAELGN